jgi:hypothetical protein
MENSNEFQNDTFIGERDFDHVGSKTRLIAIFMESILPNFVFLCFLIFVVELECLYKRRK